MPIEPKEHGKALVYYYEKGRPRGKYVPEFIADSLNNASIGTNLGVLEAVRFANSKLFRPLFTTLNLGFQSYNLFRDFFRTWTNTRGMTLGHLITQYRRAGKFARVRAFGLPKDPKPAQRDAYQEVVASEQAGILSVTYNDLVRGRPAAETEIETILGRYGIGELAEKETSGIARKGLTAVIDWVRNVGDLIETLPKGAMIVTST